MRCVTQDDIGVWRSMGVTWVQTKHWVVVKWDIHTLMCDDFLIKNVQSKHWLPNVACNFEVTWGRWRVLVFQYHSTKCSFDRVLDVAVCASKRAVLDYRPADPGSDIEDFVCLWKEALTLLLHNIVFSKIYFADRIVYYAFVWMEVIECHKLQEK